MTAKRFKKDRGTFWDNDKRLNMEETVEILNALHEENQHIKHTIKTMMENERTELGKNCLKQLYEAIQ